MTKPRPTWGPADCPAMLAFERYFSWADTMRKHVNPYAQDELRSHWKPYMAYWYGGLYTVTEGWYALKTGASLLSGSVPTSLYGRTSCTAHSLDGFARSPRRSWSLPSLNRTKQRRDGSTRRRIYQRGPTGGSISRTRASAPITRLEQRRDLAGDRPLIPCPKVADVPTLVTDWLLRSPRCYQLCNNYLILMVPPA
jgi:hypothetical protein